MAVCMLAEFAGTTTNDYDAVMDKLGLARPGSTSANPWPVGLVSHMVGVSDGALYVVDVWSSQVTWETFLQENLIPAFQTTSITPPAVTLFSVHNSFVGAAPSDRVTLPLA
jgi:hypothetical protein